MNHAFRISLVASLGCIACTQSFAPESSVPARAKEAKPAGPKLAPGWRQVDMDAVDGDSAKKLAAAKKAAKALGGMLLKTLTEAIGERRDYPRGIEVCQQAAPNMAASVSTDFDLEVGRTSFKVRNPNNRPQPWARPIVEQRYAKPLFMAGRDGEHVFMAPIKLAEVCVNCHGTAEQIPDEVETTLAKLYPEDEAIGFAPGDLRGWVWVKTRAGK